jgi:hypothetical protein
MPRFSLTKWYLDCVDRDGRSAILYSSALAWGHAAVSWQGASFHEPGKPATHRSSLSPIPLPERDGARLAWDATPLGCTVTCKPVQEQFSRRLLDRPRGSVDWRCEAPAAAVTVTLPGQPPLTGAGYAECLVLSVVPWRLPIDELRWGRWISDGGCRSLVWIEWRGPRPRADVFLDGRAQSTAAVGGDRVRAEGCLLELSGRQALYSRSIGSTLAGLGPLLSMLPAAWRDIEDTKCLSRARLECDGLPSEDGWCIDERVRFPR